MGDPTKPTQPVDQLEVIRGLVERALTRAESLDAKVDAHRAESAKRALDTQERQDRFETKLDAQRKVVGELASRLAQAESDIRELRAQDTEMTRMASETDLEHEAALGGAIAHARVVDAAIVEVRDEVADVKDKLANVEGEVGKAARIDEALCNELGLDYQTIANDAEGPAAPRPKSTLSKLARENKAGTWASAITLITLAMQLALQLLGKH